MLFPKRCRYIRRKDAADEARPVFRARGDFLAGGARRAWIAQEHPEGRITFIDLDSGQARTITGFELGARVVDGSGR